MDDTFKLLLDVNDAIANATKFAKAFENIEGAFAKVSSVSKQFSKDGQ